MIIFAVLLSFLTTLLILSLMDYAQDKVDESIKYRMKNKKRLFKAKTIYKKHTKNGTVLTLSILKNNTFDIISLLVKEDANIPQNFTLELFIDDFEPIHSSWLFFSLKKSYVKKIVINNQVISGQII